MHSVSCCTRLNEIKALTCVKSVCRSTLQKRESWKSLQAIVVAMHDLSGRCFEVSKVIKHILVAAHQTRAAAMHSWILNGPRTYLREKKICLASHTHLLYYCTGQEQLMQLITSQEEEVIISKLKDTIFVSYKTKRTESYHWGQNISMRSRFQIPLTLEMR